MVSTASFSDRLRRIRRILNIPVRDRWFELQQEDNIYSYWQGLNLLDADSVQQLRECHAQLQPTAVIQRFFRNVDYYWSPGAYAGRSAADLGSGYGHLTMWLLISGARDVLAIGDAIRISFIERLHQAAVAEGLLHARSLTTRGELLRENHRELHPDKNNACLALVLMNDTLEHTTLIHARDGPCSMRASVPSFRVGFSSRDSTTQTAREPWHGSGSRGTNGSNAAICPLGWK